ncbi:GntR family transcriptional regulator [Spiroplasma helicoides]|uniref:GntR family transcriptional regulator n=1 Tax=Spiroplasma helicoides TaxID=216938 RepID=A0A1B3SLR4_9MOLU|nr:GntR family transcriptional regulator [Spiroplasma helicoides]AOG60879.1 GntR family transcriptional regulator [Spiroplasma helicoides]
MKKWEEIYEYLFSLISEKKIKANEILPSENFLKNKFKISSQPIRKAFYKLIEDKLVISHQGKGYKVINNENNVLFSFSTLYPDAKSIYFYKGKFEVDDELRNKTKFYYEDFVHLIVVKRYIRDELHIVQTSYISDSLLKHQIDENLLNQKGILNFLKNNIKNHIGFSIKKIIAVSKKDLVEPLANDLASNNLILDKGMLFTINQQLIEYRESYYNYENFEWSFIEYYK